MVGAAACVTPLLIDRCRRWQRLADHDSRNTRSIVGRREEGVGYVGVFGLAENDSGSGAGEVGLVDADIFARRVVGHIADTETGPAEAPGAAGHIARCRTVFTAVELDVLPKAPPVITGVRGWYGAPRGGVVQPAWQHRRASARQHHYAGAHGCSRRARAAAPSGHGRATRTASR